MIPGTTDGLLRPDARIAASKAAAAGERADDAELVPELEQDRARGVRGQKPLEASAQRGLESVSGDQPLRLADNDRAPDAQRAENGMALGQDEPGDRAEDERNQRRQLPGARR